MGRNKNAIWWSPMGGLIGAVMYENEHGDRKVYIKAVAGLDEEIDKQEICDYGAKITLEQAREILAYLEKK